MRSLVYGGEFCLHIIQSKKSYKTVGRAVQKMYKPIINICEFFNPIILSILSILFKAMGISVWDRIGMKLSDRDMEVICKDRT